MTKYIFGNLPSRPDSALIKERITFIKRWLFRNRLDIWLVVLLLVLAGTPRLLGLGTFLTADEKSWIGRSYEFIRAFKDFRFNDMLQTTHPGVTTLWLSGLAVTAKMYLSHIPFSFRNMAHFVIAAQLPIAIVNTLLVGLIFWLLRELWPGKRWMALTAALFITLDPVLIGYSRVAHVDALLTMIMLAAALATIIYGERNYDRRWLMASAAAGGLAILTKVPGIFLLPWLLLVVLAKEGTELIKARILIDRGRDVLLWLVAVGLIILVLWPVLLWVPNPQGNVLLLKRDIGQAAVTPHDTNEEYQVNASYYLFTLLTRVTPLVQLLALIGIGMALKFSIFNFQSSNKDQFSGLRPILRQRLRRAQQGFGRQAILKSGSKSFEIKTIWLLLAYVFFFVVMMTIGAKKGDRYILPVFPALDVLAGVGLMYLLTILKIKFPIFSNQFANAKKRVGTISALSVDRVITALLAIYMAAVVGWYHPYEIAYSNPLLPDNLSEEVGWGEGLDKVAAWLNANDSQAVVASWYPEELGAFTTAQVAHINAHEQGKVKYIVLYRNMFGRSPEHYANNFIDEYYQKWEPVYVAEAVGKEFAWVYEKPVYERVLGELRSGVEARQVIKTEPVELAGFDLLMATYAGKANQGEIKVRAWKEDGSLIGEWQQPVVEIQDNSWQYFKFDQPVRTGEIEVSLSASGTEEGNAPTVRYTRDNNYRESDLRFNQTRVPRDLGIRLRYQVGSEIATEQQRKLWVRK